MRERPSLIRLPKVPVLITESADEYQDLQDAIAQEIKPRGIIEHIYANDISYNQWEILRLRRCKAIIIDTAFRSALEGLLKQVLREPGQRTYEVGDQAEELAQEWFTEEGKKKILELLRGFQLDESAIEAQAIRSRSSELESLDRMIASLESRRDEALRFLAGYRASVARQLRDSLDQITADVLKIEAASKKRSTAA